ncbi:MAG: MarR family transcriptional regulator [Nocardia sp.]|uniref:MarR family winged helix-turn-helix transcriptional regulator n=1 Tax=Nocardia sp. TaxID=1821 RepID=UPI002616D7B0|nr:MarR family transcriptional regulator [Nocardia sp.]MCU1639843.1 MarR family transcriptional regulator [Nocardia sp.]
MPAPSPDAEPGLRPVQHDGVEPAQMFSLLFGAMGRLRRQLGRIAGRSFDGPDLSAAQAEFLRLVGRQPGVSVKAAAAELGLAANSVSTFVTALVKAGLVVREPDLLDRRMMRLSLTADAQQLADSTRLRRQELVSWAVDQLTADQRADLRRGLDVITTLTDLLHEHEQREKGETR